MLSDGRRIYDAFTFYNELDLLDLRLHHLDGLVDGFILCEATTTHAGNYKPMFFYENRARYEAFLPKIEHVVVGDMPPPVPNRWTPENHQRNALIRGMDGIRPDDIVLVGDVDEIIDIDLLMANLDKAETWGFQMPTYFYRFNGKVGSADICTLVTRRKCIKEPGPHTSIRQHRHSYPIVKGGWHFTYLGDEAHIVNKIQNFAHGDLDTEENRQRVKDAIRDNFNWWMPNEKFAPVPLERGKFPDYLVDNQDKFRELIYKV